jgi:ABC-type antimicrobial peptide transport system permease subunit
MTRRRWIADEVSGSRAALTGAHAQHPPMCRMRLIAYTVKQRAHEIGIRLAIGAQPGDVARHVLGRGMMLAANGAGIGIVAALGVNRLLASLLYGVSATDPLSFAGATTTVLGITLVASLIPAWRAAHTDPLAVLRRN